MAAGIELATAYVSLVAETRDLGRTLERDLQRSGDQAGRRAGSDFADSFTRQTRDIDNDVSRRLGNTGGDEGGEAGRRFSSSFSDRLRGLGDSVGDRLGGAADRIGGMAGDSGGASFLTGFAGQVGSLGAKAGPIGAALAGVAAIGLGAGAVLASAIADGMQQQQSRDLIQARLGTNEETMEKIGKAAGAAFSNAFGESVEANMETAQLAIQSGVLNGEETASEMQPIIEGLQGVTDLMGGEMSDSIRAVSALMKNDLVDSSEEAFDVITRGYQRGGNIGDDLIDSLSEYSAGWKQTGFSAEFALGLINQSMDLGADNTDRAADALREFGRRMVEEGDTIKETLGALDLPVDELFTALSEGGPKGEEAFDRIFDAIRKVEDPLERAALAQAMLGDTAGDFIGTFTQWDPSRAALAFGEVAGAAKDARDVLGQNDDWTRAVNTLTVEADNAKLALAEMAGPYLSQLADWVSTHKPEIIGFFTGLVDGALLAGEGIARFVQGALHVIGPFVAITADGFAAVLDTMAGFTGAAAKVAGALGMDGMSKDLQGATDFLQDYSDKSRQGAGAMIELADSIGSTVIPGLQNMRQDLALSGEQAQDSALMMRALGDEVEMIPDEKRIIIKDNTPERQAELEKLGLTVTKLPDGTFEVTANTEEGQRIVDNFLRENNGKNVDVWVTLRERKASLGIAEDALGPFYDPGTGQGFATGGYFTGRGTGTSDSNLIRISDGEFVTRAAMTKKHRGLLEAINNDQIPAFATGGYFNADAAKSKAQAHNGEPYVYGGLDCSGYLSAVFNAGTGQSVRFVTGSDFEAMGWEPGYDPNGFSIGTDKGVGANGHMAGTLFGVNIESDGSNGIQYGGSADGALDFPFVYHWPGASGGDDPSMEDLDSGRASIVGIDGLQALGKSTGGGGGGGAGGGGASTGGTGGGTSNAKPSGSAVAVFVTNWPSGMRTVEPIQTGNTADESAFAPKTEDPPAAAVEDPNAFSVEDRLRKYGEDVGGIAQAAALETLGLEGTLFDPNHRFWQTGREVAQAFADQQSRNAPADKPAETVDNSVRVEATGLIDQRIIDEIVRRIESMQSRKALRHQGRPFG
ncbi:phage tail tape measure protein [Rhodococcus sp. 2G]|uniref:phage tail tape measure protein n=1 Tax=Rhodococcus sp. 2G TaxID=1570939 RepID=UPI000ADA2B4E|nr:phage tail tape measure protein [Rhodococcus sp. 2G]